MKEFNSIFEDQLLVRGRYAISMEVSSEVNEEDFTLISEGNELSFDLECTVDPMTQGFKINVLFNIDASYARVTFKTLSVSEETLYLGLQQMNTSETFRTEFFDYHYSLRDHIRQMDTILRFSEGKDELSLLFKTLRYEIASNHAVLNRRLNQLESD